MQIDGSIKVGKYYFSNTEICINNLSNNRKLCENGWK